MKQRRTLQELTIKDNFMFGAVMIDEENCRGLLELTLGFPIEKITVSKEKSIIYHPEYKGVRLDIVARDEAHSHYDIEMQVVRRQALGKRARYYHSQIDMELLEAGGAYAGLPEAYVIFICDYDPFGAGLYRYTWEVTCREAQVLDIADGYHTIFLSTHGKNAQDVPVQLVKFLKFVGADLDESTEDYDDAYVSKLQSSVANIKTSREMEDKYMLLWEEMIEDEREEAKAEGVAEGIEIGRTEGLILGRIESILEVLSSKCEKVPVDLCQRIRETTDEDILKTYFTKVINSKTIKEFEDSIKS